MHSMDPNDLIGRTFLKEPEQDGTRHYAKIVRKIMDDPDVEDPNNSFCKSQMPKLMK